jgi:uncharacterized repeat protein (TIGR04076 family)
MSEDNLKGSLYDDDEILRKFRESENRYLQQVTITKINGLCPYAHREGETFQVTNCNNDGLCGALYNQLHPSILTLHYRGRLPWQKGDSPIKAMCPEMKVQVEVKRIEKKDLEFLKTESAFKDMTGRGFNSLDKNRTFIEILGVEYYCAWGHKQGQRFEIDPFNTGNVCGFLYSKVYPYLNVHLSGASVPWAMEDNVVNSVCPDSYNQTSFRLVIEERKKE